MTRALIADDEPHLAHYLRDQLLALWPELEIVHLARNGIDAAARIAELEPDLAFLDIQMPGLSGLEVAQGIEGHTRVVFVTAFDEFALQAFEHAALDYVLKPVSTERLARTVARLRAARVTVPGSAPDADTSGPALAKVLQQLMAAPARPRLRYILAGQGERTRHLDVADIRFFRADDKYTVVASSHGEYLIRTTITDLAAQLDPDGFWQVHRSTVVNLAWLEGTRRDEASRLFLRMRGHADELPVSRAFVHLFKAM
ncbi:LytR/AlgR family response regulator transcription factor [Telluria aromaticivorans]|uniref:Response regulator transcription factor n=1 Tax=Telluria aromaticivorans TaxID=2725995 RepID=A0A7Y2JYB0_9BURK|nr:LytTR family DNA-binding domain-containing protein [Telluria aromaticivorans]NNG22623.1 response regulator transcription factor [Telluria aromaticivorans]